MLETNTSLFPPLVQETWLSSTFSDIGLELKTGGNQLAWQVVDMPKSHSHSELQRPSDLCWSLLHATHDGPVAWCSAQLFQLDHFPEDLPQEFGSPKLTLKSSIFWNGQEIHDLDHNGHDEWGIHWPSTEESSQWLFEAQLVHFLMASESPSETLEPESLQALPLDLLVRELLPPPQRPGAPPPRCPMRRERKTVPNLLLLDLHLLPGWRPRKEHLQVEVLQEEILSEVLRDEPAKSELQPKETSPHFHLHLLKVLRGQRCLHWRLQRWHSWLCDGVVEVEESPDRHDSPFCRGCGHSSHGQPMRAEPYEVLVECCIKEVAIASIIPGAHRERDFESWILPLGGVFRFTWKRSIETERFPPTVVILLHSPPRWNWSKVNSVKLNSSLIAFHWEVLHQDTTYSFLW